MSSISDIVVVDFWGNVFSMAVRIALEEKGIKYQYIEENLRNPRRSQLVLEMNPIQRSVPILIHKGKPVCDSTVVLEYIEETWRDGYPRLLPDDPLERTAARFWAHFIHNKLFRTQAKLLKGKARETKDEAKKELIAELKQLEELLGEKTYLGGNKFGFLDIVLIPFSSLFRAYEHHGNFKMEDACPKLSAWVRLCMSRVCVSMVLPDSLEMYELHKELCRID